MKRFLLLFALCACQLLWGQDYIHRDYYGQGASAEDALKALMTQIGKSVPFDNSALLDTYQADIAKWAVEQNKNGRVQLDLSGTNLDRIFQARQNRAANILDQGRKAADDSFRKVYFIWGWYYLSSLPPGHQLPGKEDLRQWLLEHRDIQPARLPVPMTHIEREVAAILSIVGDWDKSQVNTTPVPSAPIPVQEPEEVLPQREQVISVVASTLSQEALEAPETPALTVPVAVEQPATATVPVRTSVLVTGGLAPEPVMGIMLSVQKEWGGILAFHTNFGSSRSSYEANSDGSRVDGGYVWPDGTVRVAHLGMAAGCSHVLGSHLSAYVTAGYAYRNVLWKDGDGQWARIRDLSDRGLTLSGGVFFHWQHLALSASVSTLSFQTLGVSLGIGYAWNSLPR